MHELGIARNIVAIACERAGDRRIQAIRLQVGALSGVDVRAIRFCFPLCAERTLAAGSRLEIEEVPGAATCSGCDRAIALDQPRATCPCERRAPLVRTAGDELLITTIALDDLPTPHEASDV